MGEPNAIIADAAGLNTQQNELTLPPGSLAVATNVEITRDGVIEVARGFENFSSNLPAFKPQQLLVVGGVPYLNLDGGLWYYDTATAKWLRKTGNFGSRMGNPSGAWTDGTNVYVTDFLNHVIFSVNLITGKRSILAGRYGASGTTDGTGDAARFFDPYAISGDGHGNLYVMDQGGTRVRKVTTAGVATTLATGFSHALGIWSDGSGLAYVVDDGTGRLSQVSTSSGAVSTVVANMSNSATGVWGDGAGKLYTVGNALNAVTIAGGVETQISTLGGLGIVGDGAGSLYVASGGASVSKISTTGGTVTTVASGFTATYQPAYSAGRLFVPDLNAATLSVIYPAQGYAVALSGVSNVAAANAGGLVTDGVLIGPDASTTARRIRAAALNGNAYFTGNNGIVKSESASASMTPAGLPRCLDLNLALSLAGTPVLLANGASRGYRGVWCKRDANNNVIRGAPSSRFWINNASGGTRDVSATVTLPPEITTSHFFELYATAQQSTAAIDVGDEQRLVLEYFPTATDIGNGTFTVTDIAPDAFRAADLYTNQSQEGIAQENDRPPLARDICAFRRRMLYANFTEKHQLQLQLLGTTGMATGQTLTIGSVTLTAGTGAGAESTTTGTFQVWQTGGQDKGTQSLNVEYTCKSIVNVLNKYAQNTQFYAYYMSGVDDAPGSILLEERGVGGAAFVATSSATAIGNLFSPAIPTSGTTYTSVANTRVNRIRVSKTDEPEHCPTEDDIVVGGEDEAIERVIPLRTCVIVIKSHSIWRIVNGDPGEEPVFVDDTVSITGRDSAAKLNNVVFFLSDQGFVSVSDNGVQIVGRPIESRVLAGLEATNAPNHDLIVGIGHEQRRLYICATYDAGANETTCYMFSPIANRGKGAWTKRRLNASAFAIYNNRLMYALSSTTGNVLRQRASLRDGLPWYRDYCEDSGTFTIGSIDTVNNIVTGTLSGNVSYGSYYNDVGMGWKFYQNGNQYLVLGGANVNGMYTLVCASVAALVAGAVTIYRPVEWTVEYAPIVAGNPLDTKQFGDVLVKAETSNAYAVDVAYANQIDQRSVPYSDDWSAQPSADRVFVPKANGARASLTSNDFGAKIGLPVPYNALRSTVTPQRAIGEHLSLRLSGGVAEGYIGIKGAVVQVIDKQSNKGRA